MMKDVKFFILVALGCAFGVGGMVTPPMGVIDGSVLIMVGQIFLLAAGVEGMGAFYQKDLKKIQDTLTTSKK